VAEQMSDYLIKGAVSNAINMPSITAEEAPRLKPFVKLAEVLGAFVGQVTEEPIKEVEILFDGATLMNTRALIGGAAGRSDPPQVADVNMVSAPIMVKERGIIVSEVKRDKSGVFDGYIKLTVTTENRPARSPAPASPTTSRASSRSRASISTPKSASTCSTRPTGRAGHHRPARHRLGENGVNIANFQLGRDRPGGDAIALLYLDALRKLRNNPVARPTRCRCWRDRRERSRPKAGAEACQPEDRVGQAAARIAQPSTWMAGPKCGGRRLAVGRRGQGQDRRLAVGARRGRGCRSVRFQGGHNAGHTLVVDGVKSTSFRCCPRASCGRASCPSSATASSSIRMRFVAEVAPSWRRKGCRCYARTPENCRKHDAYPVAAS
jgi:hypothetical protein